MAFIRAADMSDGAVLFDSASKINNRARERITKGIGKPGDVIISHKGTVGRIARAPLDAPEFVCSPQTTFWRSTNEDILNQDFLYMRWPKFAEEFQVRSGETDMAGYVSLTSQRSLVLSIPPMELQRPIGALMSTLDEKIRLNRRMNETLEAMARAIFKDWFVDFGPTRAKMEGRPPYLAPDIWSLFPDRLDDEGKPEGWGMANLGAMTTELRRGISPSYAAAGGVRVLNQKCIRDRQVDPGPARRHDPERRMIDGRLLAIGDVLVNSTGVGTLGRVAQIVELEEPTIVDSHVTVVRADPSLVSSSYLGLNLTSRETEIEALGEGSTGQTELARARLWSGASSWPTPP
ncbi:restriction endonuclease subunit S [Aquabacter sp. L1I39]|uniref:restriction endonuclease subunit S n=1 Tax=Aquabacter sp. L1I39 TaxID=2820278 RepID=UPI001AD97CC7|nr:restriction endonuclease subunit S [Aquabacter sp. L1I39]QTL03918.1 restriction endonuclease subunit S [Aquabacter sp. L1I39]